MLTLDNKSTLPTSSQFVSIYNYKPFKHKLYSFTFSGQTFTPSMNMLPAIMSHKCIPNNMINNENTFWVKNYLLIVFTTWAFPYVKVVCVNISFSSVLSWRIVILRLTDLSCLLVILNFSCYDTTVESTQEEGIRASEWSKKKKEIVHISFKMGVCKLYGYVFLMKKW